MGNELDNIDLTIYQRKEIAALLKRYLPNTEVWAYGSRVKFDAKPHSDLDMVAFASKEQSLAVANLKEAFEESSLPFRVDLFVWYEVPQEFHTNIKNGHVVLQSQSKKVLPDGWRSSTWGEEISLEYGKSLKGYRESDGAYRVFGSNGAVGWTTAPLVNGPGVILGRKGAYRGIEFSRDAFYVIDTAYYVNLKSDDLHMRWLYYAMNYYKLGEIDDGSPIPSTTRAAVYVQNFVIPPLPEQKAIAHILGSLDDKIELNRKMNETLESMAQALFKSWFADFDPVIDNILMKNRAEYLDQNQPSSPLLPEGEELCDQEKSLALWERLGEAAFDGIPDEFAERAEIRRKMLDQPKGEGATKDVHHLFPCEFEDTEEMGWIPKGWKVKSFDTLTKLDTTSVEPFEQPEEIWEHYSIPSYDSSGMPSFDKGNTIKSNKYFVKSGAILSSKLNPETERTWWPFLLDEKRSICSTEFMQFVPHKPDEQAFVYSLIRSKPFQANILKRVTGSTGSRQRAQPKLVAEIDITDCGELLRAKYTKITLSLFQTINNNLIQSKSLSDLRDTLLPKLLSGEIRIPDAEKQVEEALA